MSASFPPRDEFDAPHAHGHLHHCNEDTGANTIMFMTRLILFSLPVLLSFMAPSSASAEDTCKSLGDEEQRLTDDIFNKLSPEKRKAESDEKKKEVAAWQQQVKEDTDKIGRLQKEGGHDDEIKVLKQNIKNLKKRIEDHASFVKKTNKKLYEEQKALGKLQDRKRALHCPPDKRASKCEPGYLPDASGKCKCDNWEMARLHPEGAGLACGR